MGFQQGRVSRGLIVQSALRSAFRTVRTSLGGGVVIAFLTAYSVTALGQACPYPNGYSPEPLGWHSNSSTEVFATPEQACSTYNFLNVYFFPRPPVAGDFVWCDGYFDGDPNRPYLFGPFPATKQYSCPYGGTVNMNPWCVCTSPDVFAFGRCRPADANLCPLPRTDKESPNACPLKAGNPIHVGTGNKSQSIDLAHGRGLLQLRVQYNSGLQYFGAPFAPMTRGSGRVGPGWVLLPDQRLAIRSDGVSAVRETGNLVYFATNSFVAESDVIDRLKLATSADLPTAYRYIDLQRRVVEDYDAAGRFLRQMTIGGEFTTLTYVLSSAKYPAAAPSCSLPPGTPPPAFPTPDGSVACATDRSGRQTNFLYDAQRRLSRAVDNAGSEVTFTYDESSSIVLTGQPAGNNLTTITYPDGARQVLHYNEQAQTLGTNLPNALTGISDEPQPGGLARFATFSYDNAGRGASTEHASGADRFAIQFGNSYSSALVTDPLGSQRSIQMTTLFGSLRPLGQSQPGGAGCGPSSSAITYDANANVSSRVDFNNAKTCYASDLSRNLETARVEGMVSTDACPADVAGYVPVAGTAQRKVLTQWHPDWRLEARRAEPKKVTTWVYNGQVDPTVGGAALNCAPGTALVDGKPIAVLCRQVEQATSDETGATGFSATAVGNPKITNYTYNQYGQVLTVNGPRTDVTDVTTYEYYADTQADWTIGDLKKVTNALSQVTQFTKYDRNGRVLEMLDANGVKTTNTYSPRGWLTSTVVTRAGGGATQTTTYEYDGAGQLKKVTAPDSSFVNYTYDNAHRLTQVVDSAGNRVEYVLDAMGNRTAENWKDAGGVLKKTLTRTIDALNRVQQVVGGMQ